MNNKDSEFKMAISVLIFLVLCAISLTIMMPKLPEQYRFLNIPQFDIKTVYYKLINYNKIKDCKKEITCTAIETEKGKLYVANYQSRKAFDYPDTEQFCLESGMRIPTPEEAWEMWLNSTNCHYQFKYNNEVVASRDEFLKNCRVSPTSFEYRDECMTTADNANYTCKNELLTFYNKIDHSKIAEAYWTDKSYGYTGKYIYVMDDGFSSAFKKEKNATRAMVRCVYAEY